MAPLHVDEIGSKTGSRAPGMKLAYWSTWDRAKSSLAAVIRIFTPQNQLLRVNVSVR